MLGFKDLEFYTVDLPSISLCYTIDNKPLYICHRLCHYKVDTQSFSFFGSALSAIRMAVRSPMFRHSNKTIFYLLILFLSIFFLSRLQVRKKILCKER